MKLKPPEHFEFLVDVNLPRKFSFFNTPLFTHIVDIDPKMTDDDIWQYALKNNKVILTKDSDFYDRVMNSAHSPKIIYLQLGNLLIKELHAYFINNWDVIVEHLEDCSMIVAHKDQIKVIK